MLSLTFRPPTIHGSSTHLPSSKPRGIKDARLATCKPSVDKSLPRSEILSDEVDGRTVENLYRLQQLGESVSVQGGKLCRHPSSTHDMKRRSDTPGRWQPYDDARIWFLLRSSRSRSRFLQAWLASSEGIQEASGSYPPARSDRTMLFAMKQPHPVPPNMCIVALYWLPAAAHSIVDMIAPWMQWKIRAVPARVNCLWHESGETPTRSLN